MSRVVAFGALAAAALLLAAVAAPDLRPLGRRLRDAFRAVLQVDSARIVLAQAGLGMLPVVAWVTSRLGVSVLAGLLAWTWFGFPVLGLIGFLVVHHLLGVALDVRRRRFEERRQEALLDALGYGVALMSRAGNATKMMESLAESGPFLVRPIFARIVSAGGFGPGGSEFAAALERAREDIADPLFDDLTLALLLHSRQGGKLVPALEALIEDWSETLRLQREAKAMRAGIEASVVLLAVLPFVFLITLQMAAPGLLAPLRTPGGEFVFALAACWMAIGFAVLRRMSEPPREERIRMREVAA